VVAFDLPELQISQGFVALIEKIYDGEPVLAVFSNIRECTRTIPLFHVGCEKCVAARHYAAIWIIIIIDFK
jgi:hypothetical protein